VPIDPARLCPCHGEPLYVRRDQSRVYCVVKRRAVKRRHQKTEKCKVAQRRYLRSALGRALQARDRAKRVCVGKQYVGRAKTAEQASQIRSLVAQRVAEFSAQQREQRKAFDGALTRVSRGQEGQGGVAGQVRAAAADRPDRPRGRRRDTNGRGDSVRQGDRAGVIGCQSGVQCGGRS
jgi:hypothetical protein